MKFSFNIEQYGTDHLPPDKRLPKFIVFIKYCLSALTRKWGIFGQYMDGSNYDAWNSGYTYISGVRVWYNYSVYESLQAGNLNNNPQTSPLLWELVNRNFIGATERAKYNGWYLQLTYELNTYFKKALTANGYFGFKQPPYPSPYDYGLGSGTFSSIYITNVAPAYVSYVAFSVPNADSGYSFSNESGHAGAFTVPIYSAATSYTFTINIPTSVYNSLGTTNTIRDAVIDRLVSRYLVSGTGYTITLY